MPKDITPPTWDGLLHYAWLEQTSYSMSFIDSTFKNNILFPLQKRSSAFRINFKQSPVAIDLRTGTLRWKKWRTRGYKVENIVYKNEGPYL